MVRRISSHAPDVLTAALQDGRCDVVMFPVGLFVASRPVSTMRENAERTLDATRVITV